jgi:hypothetical protein
MKKFKLNIESLENKSMMAAYSYADAELSSLIKKGYSDKFIDRQEAIEIFKSVADNNSVDINEVADLKNIVKLNMSNDIKYLSNSILSSTANKTVPSLNTNSTAENVFKLVDKWFLGKDRPATTHKYAPINGKLFVKGASEYDVKQGSIGNCYFVATLAALASKNNSSIVQMFKDNGDSTWTISFTYFSNKEYVVVDNYLPVGANGYSVFAGFGGRHYTSANNELWVSLAEKGYAQWSETGHAELPKDKMTNSYDNIGRGGWSDKVLTQITGIYAINNFTITTPKEITLKIALIKNQPIVIYRYMNTAKTVAHAYFLKSYSSTTGKYELFNPWGHSHLSLTSAEIQSQCYGFTVRAKVG